MPYRDDVLFFINKAKGNYRFLETFLFTKQGRSFALTSESAAQESRSPFASFPFQTVPALAPVQSIVRQFVEFDLREKTGKDCVRITANIYRKLQKNYS